MSDAVREIPLLWPCGTGWRIRTLLDHGERPVGQAGRFVWADTGEPATRAEIETAARMMTSAGGGEERGG